MRACERDHRRRGRVAQRVGTLALRVCRIGVFEGAEGFEGELEGRAAHQANDAEHRQARAEVHAACVAVHVGLAAASSRSEKASATRGSGWGRQDGGDTVSAHIW